MVQDSPNWEFLVSTIMAHTLAEIVTRLWSYLLIIGMYLVADSRCTWDPMRVNIRAGKNILMAAWEMALAELSSKSPNWAATTP